MKGYKIEILTQNTHSIKCYIFTSKVSVNIYMHLALNIGIKRFLTISAP